METFTHIDEYGNARMVDVSEKDVTSRRAEAEGYIGMSGECFSLLQAGKHSLSGEELYDYLVYADTGDALLSAQSEAFAAMLRAYCVPATVGEGETLFSRIINKAQSNITAFDFAEVQPLLEQMAQNTDMQYLSCGISPLAGGEDA